MLSRGERDALAVLPHVARLLYLQCLRPRMDHHYRVGNNPPVDWQMLADELSVTGSQQRTTVTVKMVRRASEQLEQAGLVVRCTQKNRLSFVFFNSEVGTKVTSKPTKGRLTGRVLDNPKRRLTPCKTTDSGLKENQQGQAKGQGFGQAPCIDIYIKKNIICECVFDPERARQDFKHWVAKGVFSVTELNNHIDGYFDFCAKRQADPNPYGLQNLLESRRYFKQQRLQNRQVTSAVLDAKRMKQRAIARREEDIADMIDSNNIARRQR